MGDEPTAEPHERRDFFISYAGTDKQWAEWIAMQLETAGYTLFIQAWDFRPGSSFVAEMDAATKRAERTLLVLSSAFLASDYTFSEWAAAFRRDPRGKHGRVLPVRIEQCQAEGLLGSIVYIDLVDLDEQQACEQLLAGVRRERVKPSAVLFPGSLPSAHSVPYPPHATTPVGQALMWNVPFPRNPFFTGREEILAQLSACFQATGQPTAISQPQAVTGLGGVGKTQIAIEYAYRHRQDYQAVLWVQANTREDLALSLLSIATLLNLPQKEEAESDQVERAVRNWLRTHTGWLLILDNADDLALARDFLPSDVGGHVLLTTRAQAMGRFARRREVEVLPPEEGTLFLLRRALLLKVDADLSQAAPQELEMARSISLELGGLPLALDQAGAYIEETGCSLEQYQHLFKSRRATLLNERRGRLTDDHPLPVATTWSLSFQQVEQANAAAADLLRFCSFLAPDAIPESIITEGAAHLGEHLASVGKDLYLLNQAIEVLRAYSLLQREARSGAEAHLSVHRLVQAVLKDQMDEQSKQQWAERSVRAVAEAFPSVQHQTWPLCERLLPHAVQCAHLIAEHHLIFAEAAYLLNQAGFYLCERARYQEAEPLLQRALLICEQQLGAEHPDTASSLNNLAGLYQAQGKYEQAEPLYQRALLIREQQLGAEHPDTAASLNNLAGLYDAQGKYEQAEPLYRRALAIREQQLGAEHPDTATSLNNLAGLYQAQGKYEQAEPLYQRALSIREQQLGAEHPHTASSLNNLAGLYDAQGKYEQAEPLYQRALLIREQQLGAEHPDTATSLNNLAALYRAQGKYEQAEPLYRRALLICEQQLGAEHPHTQTVRTNYAFLRRALERRAKGGI
jgi:tetratricopeptide (TPR) repeat protein